MSSAQKDPLAATRSVSSGTLAGFITLGVRAITSAEVEAVEEKWYNWLLDEADTGRIFDNWITAWTAFVRANNLPYRVG